MASFKGTSYKTGPLSKTSLFMAEVEFEVASHRSDSMLRVRLGKTEAADAEGESGLPKATW